MGILLSLGLLTGPAAVGQTFTSHSFTSYQAGLIPEDLVVGDFNGDGSLDFAVGNTNAGEAGTLDTISVYRNQGDGTFLPHVEFGVGDRPEGIAAGLFNAGASLDLATANYNGGTVSILLGTGTGSFTTGTTISVAGGPRGITAGDFDGDGATDLATANFDGSSVSILEGNGAGSFTVLISYAVGQKPEVIARGHLNSDSFLDLVTSDSVGDTVTVLLGVGDGTFTLFGAVPVGDKPRHVKAVDLDGDAFADLLTADNNSDTVTILQNNGGASFTNRGTLSITGMLEPVYLNTGDLNADGKLDCIVSYATSEHVGIFPGTGPFTFGPGELLTTGDTPLGIGIADFDASDRLDIAVSNALDNNVYVYLSTLNLPTYVLDNGQPGTSFTGSWTVSGAPNPFGANSLFAKSASGTTYTWNVPLPAQGSYAVYAWWTQIATRVTAAPYTITHAAGQTTVNMNQTQNGGQWNLLGTFSFSGPAGTVLLTSTSSSLSTSVDAICFAPAGPPNQPPTALIDSISPNPAAFAAPVSFAGSGSDTDGTVVAHEWRSSINGVLSNQASFVSSALSSGTHTIFFRVQDDDGAWSSDAQQALVVEQPPPVTEFIIDNGDPGTSFTGTWSTSGAPNPFGPTSLFAKNGPTYTYTFTLPFGGMYKVYAWWTQLSTRPPSAPYEIQHSGGSTTVNVDQRVNGGQWNLLGTFNFGTTGVVKITAIGTTSTCADAVRLVLEGEPNDPPVATIDSISPNLAGEGELVSFTGSGNDSDGSVVAYEWRSSIDGPLSSLASFSTSTLSVGSHTIFFRVQDDGNIWSTEDQENLQIDSDDLTLILDNGQPGTSFTGNWSVSSAPNPFGPTSLFAKNGATYTYTFNLPQSGSYTVSAWWTQLASRPASAPHEIQHAGGSTTVNVDQRVNGGQWNVLGTYNFGVTAVLKITAVGTPSTCADAIRLVLNPGVAPTAFIDSISPNPADPGESVSFSGSGTDSDGTVEAYEWRSSLDGPLANLASFSTSTLSVGTHTIFFRVQDDEDLWSAEDQESLRINAPPTASIDSISPSPAGLGEAVSFSGGGTDTDGTVAAFEWRSSIDGPLSTLASFSTSTLSLGTHTIFFRVQDNDNLWSAEDQEILVVSSAPTASIDSISPNPALPGETVSFSGSGNDTDGTVVAFEWRSSIDGSLSTLASFSTSTLSVGTHTIFFRVQDNANLWSTEDQEVLQVNSPPTASIDSISPSPALPGQTVSFSGSGNDTDGTVVAFEWRSSIDGPLSTLASFSTSTLSLGIHTIFFRVKDNTELWSLEDQENLVVGSAPTAFIDGISPSPANQGESISFAGHGTDSDGTVVAFEWRSSIDGPLSTLASFSTSTLSVGTHTIFFRVKDNLDLWSAEDQRVLQVNSSGPVTLIMDNGDPGTSFTGTWSVSGAPNPFGPSSLFAKDGPTYTYTFTIAQPGNYIVRAWWTQLSTRPTSAPYEIQHAGGTTTVNVDQRVNGGQWNVLGVFNLGATAVIKITALGPASTCADAVSLVSAGGTDVIVDNGGIGTSFTGSWAASGAPNPFGPSSLFAKNGETYSYTIPATGTYRIHAWWTSLSTRHSAVPIAIQHSGGTDQVTVNQKVNGGQWNLLGTYTLNGQTIITITAPPSAESTCADAVRLEYVGP